MALSDNRWSAQAVSMRGTGKHHLSASFERPLSVLLGTASAAGSIAAARALASSGVTVGVVSTSRLSAAAWSRRVSHRWSTPSESDGQRFVDRLLEIGSAHPGQILLPTSDETAWLYTLHAAVLREHFCVYQPSIESMRRILDKNAFAEAAINAGLIPLPNWELGNPAEITALAPTLPYPILIKPRTHVHRLRNDKGAVVHSSDELIREYGRIVDRERARAADNPLIPNAGLPILQPFVSTARNGVCSISGFIDKTGELFVTRRSVKVFQRSQPVGVGICFESLPSDPAMSDGVRRLCGELGYFGVFEVEFIQFDGQWAVIDFNPRFFNQIGMDIRRGMPLPMLACLDAAGQRPALQAAVEDAQSQDRDLPAAFKDAFTLRAILLARALTGRLSWADWSYWRTWAKRRADYTVDYGFDTDDRMPGVVHALSEIRLGIKAIPRFLNSTPRISPVRTHPSAEACS
jgi:predicted ATP-grasp superfamily ATP-dependent carboligase